MNKSRYVTSAFISTFDLTEKPPGTNINPIVKATIENTENVILQQLSDLVNRGLLVVQEEKPTLTAAFLCAEKDGVEFRIARQVRLVLKDQEYVESLEKKIADLETQLKNYNEIFTKINVALKKQQD